MIERLETELLHKESPDLRWRMAAALAWCAAASSLACLAVYRHQLQASQEQLATQVQAREAARQLQQESEYDAHAAQLQAVAQLPWPQALTALEQVRPVGVRVAAIEMTARTGSLQLDVELAAQVSLASYLQRLNEKTSAWEWLPLMTSAGDANGRSAVIIARSRGRVPAAPP